jgi:hypothetical protein
MEIYCSLVIEIYTTHILSKHHRFVMVFKSKTHAKTTYTCQLRDTFAHVAFMMSLLRSIHYEIDSFRINPLAS